MAIHVDQMITAAIARGELDNLPYHGVPIPLDDDRNVPPELRMTYRILKGAGLVPGEVQEMKAIAALQKELQAGRTPDERNDLTRQIHRRQAILRTRLERMPKR
jgi:hypothetical protein